MTQVHSLVGFVQGQASRTPAHVALATQLPKEVQSLGVVGHDDHSVCAGAPQLCQHVCHQGKLAAQHLPAHCQLAPADTPIVKEAWGEEGLAALQGVTRCAVRKHTCILQVGLLPGKGGAWRL